MSTNTKVKAKVGWVCSTAWDCEAEETDIAVYPTRREAERRLACLGEDEFECKVYKIEMRLHTGRMRHATQTTPNWQRRCGTKRRRDHNIDATQGG